MSIGWLAWGSLLLIFPAVSLWGLCEPLFPPLQMQRSPGHFFDTIPFWLCLGFAAALAAVAKSVANPRAAHAAIGAIGVAVAVDYWPSSQMFFEGSRMKVLERAADLLRSLPGEGGSLRVAIPRRSDPQFGWMLAQTEAGYARNWLPWQAGRYWNDFVFAITGGNESGGGRLPYPELMEIARVRYFLLGGTVEMTPPWTVVGRAHNLQLWQLSAVAPPAAAYRAYTRLDADPEEPARFMMEAVQSNALLIHSPARDWSHPSRELPGPPPFSVEYRRPEPEQIELELDAGAEPALILVSESYHPWWRARIDGVPATVVRAHYSLMAVPVPEGAHRVELRFEPPTWLAAIDGISQLALVALLAGVPISVLRRRRDSSRLLQEERTP